MTTVTAALNRIARKCSVQAPTSWISATREDHVEIRDDFFNETVEDIFDRVDPPKPISSEITLTAGTGTTNADGSETHDLPTDFLRLQKNDWSMYDDLQDRPAVPIESDGYWTHLTDVGSVGSIKIYRLAGYDENFTVDIYRPTGPVVCHYISKNWMANAAGTAGSMYTAETDVLLLPRTLVESGTSFRFRKRRGLPFQADYLEYEAKMRRLISNSKRYSTIKMGGRKFVDWRALVPAYIPDS